MSQKTAARPARAYLCECRYPAIGCTLRAGDPCEHMHLTTGIVGADISVCTSRESINAMLEEHEFIGMDEAREYAKANAPCPHYQLIPEGLGLCYDRRHARNSEYLSMANYCECGGVKTKCEVES